MVRKMLRAGVVAALGMVAVLATYGVATSANLADPDISEVMSKSFGKGGLKGKVSAAVKGGKWEDATKAAKEWNELGTALAKSKPPKGDEKVWEENCKKFSDSTKAILAGTEKKDAKATNTALSSFKCMDCHKAHK
ncbi:MAG TPA: hypothetical protein VM529_22050 [Gemmata sp.]|nr:hypothetical protein [Gemmata sp.]